MKTAVDQIPADRAPARAAPRTPATSFWILAAALFTLTVAAAVPSPLYVVYQHRWGFSTITLTAVFAVYAIALLVTLVTAGGLSDFLGRRPVLAVSLVIEVASMAVFLTAHGVGQLLVARILQGIATGAALGAISAGLVDLQPAHRPRLNALVNSLAPTVGLATGALLAGLLVQYAPAPTTLVFTLLLVAFVLLAAALVVVPETVAPRPGALASLRPRATVPSQARRQFLTVTPALVAAWAVGGLYMSLGPSLAAGVLGVANHVVGGLVVSTLTGAGAVAVLAMRDRTPRQMMTFGVTVLAAGTTLTLLGVALAALPVFFAGTAVAGAGFGTTFLGGFRALAALAGPHQRAELFAAMYLVSYLAFSVPALLAGLAVTVVGLTDTTIAYGGMVVLFALSALALGRRRPDAAAVPACQAARAELGQAT
jgi:predicted MFS family arabinose efflux permease